MHRFGGKLRTLRARRKLSQRQLGHMLGVGGTHIGKLERSEKTPNVALLLKIADLFGVSLDQLARDDLELD